MSENNLKLWTCYPKNKRIENFNDSNETEEQNSHYEHENFDDSEEEAKDSDENIENFDDSEEENDENTESFNDSDEPDEHVASESYEHATENFTDTAAWECVPTNNIETFQESENSIEDKINGFKKSLFGDSEYCDYYFYGLIIAVVFIIILLMRS